MSNALPQTISHTPIMDETPHDHKFRSLGNGRHAVRRYFQLVEVTNPDRDIEQRVHIISHMTLSTTNTINTWLVEDQRIAPSVYFVGELLLASYLQ